MRVKKNKYKEVGLERTLWLDNVDYLTCRLNEDELNQQLAIKRPWFPSSPHSSDHAWGCPVLSELGAIPQLFLKYQFPLLLPRLPSHQSCIGVMAFVPFSTQTYNFSTAQNPVTGTLLGLLQTVRLNHTFEQIGVIAHSGNPVTAGRQDGLAMWLYPSVSYLLSAHHSDSFNFQFLLQNSPCHQQLSLQISPPSQRKLRLLANIENVCLSGDSHIAPTYTLASTVKYIEKV